jgi:hypothetical protein
VKKLKIIIENLRKIKILAEAETVRGLCDYAGNIELNEKK